VHTEFSRALNEEGREIGKAVALCKDNVRAVEQRETSEGNRGTEKDWRCVHVILSVSITSWSWLVKMVTHAPASIGEQNARERIENCTTPGQRRR
jgi:hypothetical protein